MDLSQISEHVKNLLVKNLLEIFLGPRTQVRDFDGGFWGFVSKSEVGWRSLNYLLSQYGKGRVFFRCQAKTDVAGKLPILRIET